MQSFGETLKISTDSDILFDGSKMFLKILSNLVKTVVKIVTIGTDSDREIIISAFVWL